MAGLAEKKPRQDLATVNFCTHYNDTFEAPGFVSGKLEKECAAHHTFSVLLRKRQNRTTFFFQSANRTEYHA
jgi:hypothetical protein